MRARLVKIGNSRGLHLAKPLLELAGLSDEVDIQAAPGVLTIRPVARPRAGLGGGCGCSAAEGIAGCSQRHPLRRRRVALVS